MPIRPENKHRYPKNWPEISHRIRFVRAAGRCECRGECGMPGHLNAIAEDMQDRCWNRHGEPSGYTGHRVILTTAHLDHTPENCQDDNLKAMCQGCHLWYDREHHAETAWKTREAEELKRQPLLIDEPPRVDSVQGVE